MRNLRRSCAVAVGLLAVVGVTWGMVEGMSPTADTLALAWQTAAFRTTVLAGLATLMGGLIAVLTFMWKILGAVKSKAKLEQRVEAHLDQADELITEFRVMQTAIARSEERFQSLSDRLGRFIETTDEANREMRASIRALTGRA